MGAQFGEGWQQVDEVAAEITASQNRAYDLDVLRQALTVAMLRHLGNSILTPNSTACVIGDGFATTTSLLLGTASAGAVVMVNLQKQLLVDLVFLREYLGRSEFERRVMLTVEPCQEFKITQDSIIAVMARDHTVIRQIPIDYAINIASMQEMNPPVIEQYFSDLRHVASARPVHLYCCNREEKTLPDGTVIRFLEYPWKGEDQILHEGLPLWHQEYYSVIPPFYRPYDGPHMHRWVRLTGNVGSSGAS